MENIKSSQKKIKRKLRYLSDTGAKTAYARARRQRATVILSVFSVIALVFLFQIVHAEVSKNAVNHRLTVETARYSKLKDENVQLKTKVKQMNNDDYLEKLIRSKYLYTKKGETVYNLPLDAK